MGSASLIEINDQTLLLSFEGEINEKFQWLDISQHSFQSVDIDLEATKSINSLGILHWMRWWNQLLKERTIVRIRFLKAKPFFLNCAAIVKGFLPEGSIIQSFYVDYGDDSGESELRFFDIDQKNQEGLLEIPEKILVERDHQQTELDMTCIPQTAFRALSVKVKIV